MKRSIEKQFRSRCLFARAMVILVLSVSSIGLLAEPAGHGTRDHSPLKRTSEASDQRALSRRLAALEKSLGMDTTETTDLSKRLQRLETSVEPKPAGDPGLIRRIDEIARKLNVEFKDPQGLVVQLQTLEAVAKTRGIELDSKSGDGMVEKVTALENKLREASSGEGIRHRLDSLERLLIRVGEIEANHQIAPNQNATLSQRLAIIEKKIGLTVDATSGFRERLDRLETSQLKNSP